jgi:FtsP/CotA-like multicopper oxidase with cupredoxin domain
MKRTFSAVFAAACVFAALSFFPTLAKAEGKTRTYYVGVDEIDWDYTPTGMDKMMGMAPDKYSKMFFESDKHQIGHVYRKAIYREYTDATFTKLKPRAPEWEHLGMLGPAIHAEVGDTIQIFFKNNGTQSYSMHPHGVLYEKSSEGSYYNDGANDPSHNGVVAPGGTHTYIWQVPERAGPGPNDPSSIVWLYHSHNYEGKDTNAGLIGTIIVTRKGMARPDGTPKDVDREFVSAFLIIDENNSWYIDQNIQAHTTDPKTVKKLDASPSDADGNFSLVGSGFVTSNFRSTINGYMFGNMPMMAMHKGEHVRWYLVTLGDGANFHTPHWHGNVVTVNGRRTDILALSPAQMITADMVPDNVGTWMYHCHVSEHMETGMMAMYQVLP